MKKKRRNLSASFDTCPHMVLLFLPFYRNFFDLVIAFKSHLFQHCVVVSYIYIQRLQKDLRPSRPLFSGSPGAVKNATGCGCMLDPLLFIRISEDMEWKTNYFSYC
jgi:hypothetical protein